ncbi:transposase, partial [Bacillus cereus]|nr:transposase [Bacillus cereus]
MRLFVAIDVSSEKLDVWFIDSHDIVLKEICIS